MARQIVDRSRTKPRRFTEQMKVFSGACERPVAAHEFNANVAPAIFPASGFSGPEFGGGTHVGAAAGAPVQAFDLDNAQHPRT